MAMWTINNVVANDPPGAPGATPVVYKSPCRGNGGSAWVDNSSCRTRGTTMENDKLKTKTKTKTKQTGVNLSTTKAGSKDNEGTNAEKEREREFLFARRGSVNRSPPPMRPTALDGTEDDENETISGASEEEAHEGERTELSGEEGPLDEIMEERGQLERFLFNDSNKISKSAIKYILAKWAILENKLQNAVIEKEKWKAAYHARLEPETRGHSYAYVAAGTPKTPMGPEKEKIKKINAHKVVLIKPVNEEEDGRTNEEIKKDVIKELMGANNRLRIKSIRQMRGKGVVVEVEEGDMEIIKKTNLEKKELRIEEPKKINPTLIIYDVEKEHKFENLKDEFIFKNCDEANAEKIEELRKNIVFKYSMKGGENRVSWIIQMPGPLCRSLIDRGRIYLQWSSYRVKEYTNIIRCFKCHGYGHLAKVCKNAATQLCETCGGEGHLRSECTSKESLCINCKRGKRKETNHAVRNPRCPEYLRQLELYHKRIKWS